MEEEEARAFGPCWIGAAVVIVGGAFVLLGDSFGAEGHKVIMLLVQQTLARKRTLRRSVRLII